MKELIVGLMLIFVGVIWGVDVEGIIDEDTVWSADASPYHVTGDVTVTEGVTLTIEPGVEVFMKAMRMYDHDDYLAHADISEPEHTANLIIYGSLVCEGTESDSICFTREPDSLYYHWGVIAMINEVNPVIFRYCRIEHSSESWLPMVYYWQGAITSYSRDVILENNYFYNNCCNYQKRYSGPANSRIIIRSNYFMTEIPGVTQSYWGNSGWGESIIIETDLGNDQTLVADNYFECKFIRIGGGGYCLVNNTFREEYRYYPYNNDQELPMYICDNDWGTAFGTMGGIEELEVDDADAILANNLFSNMITMNIDLDDGNFYFFNNRVTNTVMEIGNSSWDGDAIFFNNYVSSSLIEFRGYSEIYNNVARNCSGMGLQPSYNASLYNNVIIGAEYALNHEASFGWIWTAFRNSIYLDCQHPVVTNGEEPFFNPAVQNCLMDFNIPISIIDLGGNIIDVDLDEDDVFVDAGGGDFHLLPGSVCIDAGYAEEEYPFYDYDYAGRVWDGDEDGNAVIDIGALEYGSPGLGGIEGYVYAEESGDILSYALVRDVDEICNFDFSDSTGYYRISLADGIYDLITDTPFYAEMQIDAISVSGGEFTEWDIYLDQEPAVENEQDMIVENVSGIQLYNYPNPFTLDGRSGGTNICYSGVEEEGILTVYNIKGQKVWEYQVSGTVGNTIFWDGCNMNNQKVGSGIYFCHMISADSEGTTKLLLLK